MTQKKLCAGRHVRSRRPSELCCLRASAFRRRAYRQSPAVPPFGPDGRSGRGAGLPKVPLEVLPFHIPPRQSRLFPTNFSRAMYRFNPPCNGPPWIPPREYVAPVEFTYFRAGPGEGVDGAVSASLDEPTPCRHPLDGFNGPDRVGVATHGGPRTPRTSSLPSRARR